MLNADDVVFLLDVDNTLLENDRFAADLRVQLTQGFGAEHCEHYWSLYNDLRKQLVYADYLTALQQFRPGLDGDPDLLLMSAFMLDYPFDQRLYRHALETATQLRSLGLPFVLSNGDIVFQPRKVERSGIWDALDGRVLIYLHKQRNLQLMEQRFPAAHYVIVDDRPQVLAAMKPVLGERLTTVFVRQGHYAAESVMTAISPPTDRTIARIGDLCELKLAWFLLDTSVAITKTQT